MNRLVVSLSLCVLLCFNASSRAAADGLEQLVENSSVLVPLNDTERTELDVYFDVKNSEKRIAEAVEFLASDGLAGRGLGKDGLAKAAQYIANAFSVAGLRTSFWNGLPYQNFPVENMTALGSTASNQLAIAFPDQHTDQLAIDSDFRPMTIGGNGAIDGELVFVGYGISANGPGWSYDEYQDVNASGKVVIVLRKEPQQANANSPFDGLSTSSHSLFATKLKNAKLHGAKAMLLVNDATSLSSSDNPDAPLSDALPSFDAAGKSSGRQPFPTMFITRAVAEKLLRTINPNANLADIEKSIDDSLKPSSVELTGVRAIGNVELTQQRITTSNVVASIEGRGNLAHEAIVIGAHYDHVGMGEYGSLSPGVVAIHNGADDNASGTSALIELSRRFGARSTERPENYRRILFIAFSGEERGLLGSKYYVKHPVHELSKTVTMVNLDMIGRLGSNRLIVYGVGSAPTFESMVRRFATNAGLTTDMQSPALGPSDHQPFFEFGVPVLHMFTGTHAQYHRPSDDFEKINTTGIARITDMVYQLVDSLAQSTDRPAYIPVGGRANIQIPSEERGSLGVRLRGELNKPILLSVEVGGPADIAGLKVGDEIQTVDGLQINSVPELLEKMRAYPPKAEVVVDIVREGQKMRIPVILGHY